MEESTEFPRSRQERIPPIIAQCLERHEQQYARLVEMCLEAKEQATPSILSMGRQVVDELREELLQGNIRRQP